MEAKNLFENVMIILGLLCYLTLVESTRKFLQVSDIHLDLNYKEDGNEAKFCREVSGKASKYGSYKCDPPKILVESAFEAMKKYSPNPEFILWTGDNSAHDQTLNKSDIMSNLRFVTQKFHKFYPGVPVIPVLGNHDSAPKDYFPDSKNESTPKQAYSDYITEGSFGDLLHARSKESEEFKQCGYYVLRNSSFDLNVTQTFIVLNTGLYYHNKAIDPISYPPDPCGQFDWLNKTLAACKPKERVFIIAHIPPGYFEHWPKMPMFSNENYTKSYMDIITRKDYAKKIVAHFYGHTHTDSFRLFMDPEHKEPVGLAFIAPSITPLVYVHDGVNPSFREYEYDHINRTIMTYNQYYLPLNLFINDTEEDDEEVIDYKNYPDDSKDEVIPDDTETKPILKSSDRRKLNSKMLSKREAVENNADNDTETTTIMNDEDSDGEVEQDNEMTTLIPVQADEVTEEAPIDHEFKNLVDGWTFGFNAALDFNIPSMDIRSMYNKVFSDMKQNPEGSQFKMFLRHAFVNHDVLDGLDCNKTCQSDIICSLTHITEENFKDCLVEEGVLHPESLPTPPNPIQMTTLKTTTSTSTTTTKNTKRTTQRTTKTTTFTTTAYNYDSTTHKPYIKSKEIGISNNNNILDDQTTSSNVIKGVVIGFALVVLIALGIAGLIYYQKVKRRRYCSQEFLLDSFRYDGYSQLDQPAHVPAATLS